MNGHEECGGEQCCRQPYAPAELGYAKAYVRLAQFITRVSLAGAGATGQKRREDMSMRRLAAMMDAVATLTMAPAWALYAFSPTRSFSCG